uniref:Cytohesin Ubiquitin Protein Inducing domain-containing protein n=1 Tax=Gouania willdenowi TaxID=441366 RepID=A0A8C5H7X2_GOUWI
MTAVESKEEISDTDSGIILHSGPDSPTSPLKELSTHTRALKLKHQSLEDRLGLCLLELRQLCIREAELTGTLSEDYPLIAEEKPPQVRRRIGASFKLDECLIHDSELQSLETDLALQRQIYEAARKLSLEGKLSKPQKKSRLQQCKREEKKVKELQEAVFQHRVKSECSSPCLTISSRDNKVKKKFSSSADVDSPCPLSPPTLCTSFADPLQLSVHPPLSPHQSSAQLTTERSPIQNSPWKESSLDQPYQKTNSPQSASSSRSRCETQVFASISGTVCVDPRLLRQLQDPSHSVRQELGATSEPLHQRPLHPRRRCVADFLVRSPEYSPLRPYQSSSEDSSSEHSSSSSSSNISSPGRNGPTEIPKLCPPPYGFHFGAQNNGLSSFSGLNNNMKATVKESPLSPQEPDEGKSLLSPVARSASQRKMQEGLGSPQSILKPPPPYTRLVRAPSLREYPNHAIRVMPRDIVSEELKSWHQRNQLQKLEGLTSPTSPHLPLFHQVSSQIEHLHDGNDPQ